MVMWRAEPGREQREWQGEFFLCSLDPKITSDGKITQCQFETPKHTLSERKAEREREHSRHAASLRQLEHSLNSRERMYKERILGLEEQVRQTREDD